MDLMAKLPDEILTKVLHHLPSLRDQLRVESVSHRFQACLIRLLNTNPIPFSIGCDNLNEYSVTWEQLPAVLQTLGRKTKFSKIDIYNRDRDEEAKEELDLVLTLLATSDNDCLEKVTRVRIDSEDGCSQAALKEVIARCAKLAEVYLEFDVRPPNSAQMDPEKPACPMDLGTVLEGKALTALKISLHYYTQEEVIQLFQAIKPNTLKWLYLQLDDTTLNVGTLVTELGGAWSVLEEIYLLCERVNMRMDTVFSSLTRFPALRMCTFDFSDIEPNTQIFAALVFLFANDVEIKFSFSYSDGPGIQTGCQYVALIRQVQKAHPELVVDFPADGNSLTLTLGKVSFEQQLLLESFELPCGVADCPDCRIFHPRTMASLVFRAHDRARGTENDVHLANARLYRCKLDSVVAQLNQKARLGERKLWVALNAERNEAGDLATITFQTKTKNKQQFQITVECGHCFNGCIRCVQML